MDLLLHDFARAFVQLSLVYYVGGYLLQFVLPRIFSLYCVQKAERPNGQILADAKQSLIPITVKAIVWTVVAAMQRSGVGRLYLASSWSTYEALYTFLVIIVMDWLHDAWFYWTHRLLHLKPIYKHIHALHHRSQVPSAFTGYSFHCAEAIVVFANEILICFLIPIDLRLHRIYHLLTTLIHQGGHAGYEIYPFVPVTINGVLRLILPSRLWIRWTRYLVNTIQHHDMHHTHVACHYSLYFTHWDRFAGTLHPSYDAIVAEQSM